MLFQQIEYRDSFTACCFVTGFSLYFGGSFNQLTCHSLGVVHHLPLEHQEIVKAGGHVITSLSTSDIKLPRVNCSSTCYTPILKFIPHFKFFKIIELLWEMRILWLHLITELSFYNWKNYLRPTVWLIRLWTEPETFSNTMSTVK